MHWLIIGKRKKKLRVHPIQGGVAVSPRSVWEMRKGMSLKGRRVSSLR
jgi:hypothetical protein